MNVKRIVSIISTTFSLRVAYTQSLLRERDHWRKQYRNSEQSFLSYRRTMAQKFLMKEQELELLRNKLQMVELLYQQHANNSELLNAKLFELFTGTTVQNMNTTLKAVAKCFANDHAEDETFALKA